MTLSVTTWRAVNVTTLSEAMTVSVLRAMSAVIMNANVRICVHCSMALLVTSSVGPGQSCRREEYSLVSTVCEWTKILLHFMENHLSHINRKTIPLSEFIIASTSYKNTSQARNSSYVAAPHVV